MKKLLVSLALHMAMCFVAAWAPTAFGVWSLPHILCECGNLLTCLTSLYTSGISFGWPDLGPNNFGRCCMDAIQVLCFICFFILTLAIAESDVVPPMAKNLSILLFSLYYGLAIWLGGRGRVLVVFALVLVSGGIYLAASSQDYKQLISICDSGVCLGPRYVKLPLVILLCCCTRYLQDQRLAFLISVQMVICLELEKRLGLVSSHLTWIPRIGVSVLVIYGICVLRRRGRTFPPGLAGAKFVRLGFLRKLYANGHRICRCQDLPPEAFGDPFKALHLVIVSHRWLHPMYCDVGTEDCPEGLKLRQVLRKLDAVFSPLAVCEQGFFDAWYPSLWHAACFVGGWDVLLFFDFMSVPQLGLDGDGMPMGRSASDQDIFAQCLPCMGTLYSMFPVLILDSYGDGDAALAESDLPSQYFESGWCSLEFKLALLGKQSHMFRINLQHQEEESVVMNTMAAQSFRKMAVVDLEAKHFCYESDRIVAKSILDRMLNRRMLLDAVESGNLVRARHVLERLCASGLAAVLDEPVDAHLNTLLHVAVAGRREGITRLLLSFGARPDLCNSRGDRPWQWFIWPRLNRASGRCLWQVYGRSPRKMDRQPEEVDI